MPAFREINVDDPEFNGLKKIFFALIVLILFIRFSVVSPLMKAFMFLLRFRHLSNTGFHLFHQIGFGPCVRLIPMILKQARLLFAPPESEHRVLWCDNVRRESAGRLQADYAFDHTAIGHIRLDSPLPLIDPACTRINLLHKFGQVLLSTRIKRCDFIMGPSTYAKRLIDRNFLTVPLRASGSTKNDFIGSSLQDYAIGTVAGTCRFLKDLHDLPRTPHYQIVVTDYDICMRTLRTLHSDSFIGAFESLNSRFFFFQAPWHIYKRLAEALGTHPAVCGLVSGVFLSLQFLTKNCFFEVELGVYLELL